jgi:hypothetical protein
MPQSHLTGWIEDADAREFLLEQRHYAHQEDTGALGRRAFSLHRRVLSLVIRPLALRA